MAVHRTFGLYSDVGMTENREFRPEIGGPLMPQVGLPEHKEEQTGWPAIAILTFVLAGVFAGGCLISGKSAEQCYQEWPISIWITAAFIVLCILAELSCVKCPRCRSRAITLVSEQEVDRRIGQKIVNQDTFGVGGFQTFGGSNLAELAAVLLSQGGRFRSRRGLFSGNIAATVVGDVSSGG